MTNSGRIFGVERGCDEVQWSRKLMSQIVVVTPNFDGDRGPWPGWLI